MTPATNELPKFWSDDFDMDLLKVFPNAPNMLREPGALLWTIGHESYGRLNHPVTWNSHGAFAWTERPKIQRDKNGWININGCVCNEPEIECTWLEWMRDAWSHHYGAILLPSNIQLPSSEWRNFEPIMYDLRGWHKRDVSEPRKRALHWIMRCDFLFNEARRGVIRELSHS